MLGLVILLLLIALLIALIPVWPYSREWGYFPGGVIAALVILWFLLIWFGYVAIWYPWTAAPAPAPAVVD